VSPSVGACWGTWGVHWLEILRNSWRAPEREHLSFWELCYGGSFPGIWKDTGRRAQWMDITLCRGPTEEFSRRLVYRALQRLWREAPFSTGVLLSIMGGSVHRELWETVVRELWKWGIFLYGRSVKGTWTGGSFAGDPQGYVKEGTGNGHFSLGTPLGNLEGARLLGTLRDGWDGCLSL